MMTGAYRMPSSNAHSSRAVHARRRAWIAAAAVCLAMVFGAGSAGAQATASTTTLSVNVLGTTTGVSTVGMGEGVTLTAMVTAGGAVHPGTVEFLDTSLPAAAQVVGTAQLTSAGTASISVRPVVGTHQYEAIFVGTAGVAASTSGATALTVTGLLNTNTYMTSSGTTSNYTLSATLDAFGFAVSPTGSMSFVDTSNGNAVLGTVALSSLTFALKQVPVAPVATGTSPLAIATGDFNGDGYPDMVVANGGDQTLSVYVGGGDSTFTETQSISVGGEPVAMAVGDFENNGTLDLVVADASNNRLILYHGNGDGTFTLLSTVALGSTPAALAVGDVDNDGQLDVVVTLPNANAVAVLLNSGNGTLTSKGNVAVGTTPEGVVLGYFTGSGNLDLATANYGSNDVSVMLGAGDGTFTAAAGSPFAAGAGAVSLAAADLNGDGFLDLAVANLTAGTVSILTGDGTGNLTASSTVTVDAKPTQILALDYNNDGTVDLLTANQAGTVDVLYNSGLAAFGAPVQVDAYGQAVTLAAPDLNGDGRPDLLVVDEDTDMVSVYLTGQEATATITGVTFSDAAAHLVDASYGGDTVYAGGTTNTVTLQATNFANSTTTVLAAAPASPTVYGPSVTLTATVTPTPVTGGAGVGTVAFYDGVSALGTQAVNSSGVAQQVVAAPGVGTHSYTAVYSGATGFGTSASAALGYTVGKNTATLGLPSYTGTGGVGGTETGTLTPASTGTGQALPTGTLTYQFPGYSTQTATVTNGTASIPMPSGVSGTGSVTVTYGGDTNYTGTTGTLSYSISKYTLTVAVANASRTYGAANPTFTSTVTGAQNGDTFTVTYTTTATTASAVGPYTINASVTGANASNYSVNVTPGTLTVTQAPLTITANSASKLVGAANPTFTGLIAGTQNGDALTLSFTTTATTSSPAGTYPIVPSVTGANVGNYNVTAVNGVLTVGTLYPLTVTVNNGTRLYGAANPTFTGSVNGAQGGDTFTVTYATTATATSAVGTYPISATVTGANISNYTLTVNAGTLTITQASSTLTLASSVGSAGYGSAVVLTATANPATSGIPTGTVTFYDGATKLGTASLTAGAATLSVSTLALGSHTLSAIYGGDADFTGSSSNTVAEIINKATLTVTVNNVSRVYGAADPAFSSTITGAAPGDTFTVTYSSNDTVSSPIGGYPISGTVAGANLANYNLSVVPGTLTITTAPLTVTANNVSRMYATANPTFTGTVTGAQNGDSFTLSYTTSAGATSDVGSYAIIPTATGTNIGDYTVTYVDGTLTITPLTGVTLTAGSATRSYGTANPAFTATLSGNVSGLSLTLGGTTTAILSSDAGTYAIVPTYGGINAGDIAPTLVNGTLTIVAASTATTLAVPTSSSSQGSNVALTATVTTSVSGVPTGTVTFYAGGTLLGSAPLSGGVATLTTNSIPIGTSTLTARYTGSTDFTSSTSPGTIYLVTLPILTATANNATRAYGAANPTFSGTLSGAQNGDTFALSFSTTATINSPPGTYAIVPNVSGANIGNYALVSVPGTLTISPLTATLLLNASSSSTPYGSSLVLTTVLAGSGSNTPTGKVSFYDGTTLLGTATPTSGVAQLTVTTLAVGAHSLTAQSAADTYYAAATSNAVAETITSGSGGGGGGSSSGSYAVSASPTAVSVKQGSTVTTTLTITPLNGFTGSVTLSCANLPQYATCSFSPATVVLATTTATTSTLTIGTGTLTGAVSAPQLPGRAASGMSLAGLLWLPAGLLAGLLMLRRRKSVAVRLAVLLLAGALGLAMLAGCAQVTVNSSGSGSTVTPVGTTTFTVAATTVGTTNYQTIPITITVTQ